MRIVHVLWNGALGGAQAFTGELCAAMRKLEVDARIAFVSQPAPLCTRLDAIGVPHQSLDLPRGRSVLRHPFALARTVRLAAPEGAFVVSSGYLAGAVRLGGYRGAIVAVEHGTLLQVDRLPPAPRFLRRLDRASGLWACDAEVGVSRFMFDELERRRHAPRLVCIANGVDLDRFRPPNGSRDAASEPSRFVIGCAARLIPDKGVDDLMRAVADGPFPEAVLRIAGDGPYREPLEGLARSLRIADRTEFHGYVPDMPAFWRSCDVGVVPSSSWIESFSIAAVEAMACGRPVVASRIGALPSTVLSEKTGIFFEPGDVSGLVAALRAYAEDVSKRKEHGVNARTLCEERYDLMQTAASYRDLMRSISDARAARATGTIKGASAR